LVPEVENLDPDVPAHDCLVERMRMRRPRASAKLGVGVVRRAIDVAVDRHLVAGGIMASMDGAEIQRIFDPEQTELEARYNDSARGPLAQLAPTGRGQ
jgi:hypothetical protein